MIGSFPTINFDPLANCSPIWQKTEGQELIMFLPLLKMRDWVEERDLVRVLMERETLWGWN